MKSQKKFQSSLETAGGKILCPRCQAHSKRTKLQCGKPALKGKSVCQFHGGLSTGPKTDAGKTRQKASVTKSGKYTKNSCEARASNIRELRNLEDAMYILNMTKAPRTRGRKPIGHINLQNMDDIVQFAVNNLIHLPKTSIKPT
jgi:hypothetical protein